VWVRSGAHGRICRAGVVEPRRQWPDENESVTAVATLVLHEKIHAAWDRIVELLCCALICWNGTVCGCAARAHTDHTYTHTHTHTRTHTHTHTHSFSPSCGFVPMARARATCRQPTRIVHDAHSRTFEAPQKSVTNWSMPVMFQLVVRVVGLGGYGAGYVWMSLSPLPSVPCMYRILSAPRSCSRLRTHTGVEKSGWVGGVSGCWRCALWWR
jgi:hypothetical protein